MKNFLAPSILAGNHANLSDALNIAESDGTEVDTLRHNGWTFCSKP